MTRENMTAEAMGEMSANTQHERHVDPSNRIVDFVAHGSSIVVGVAVAAVVGQPVGWIGFVLPLGPVLVIAAAAAAGAAMPRGARSLLAFTIVSGVVIGGGWLLTHAGELWAPLSLLYPLGVLAFIAGLVNWLMLAASRTWRAWRRWPFDYPWIPDPLARLVGLPADWEE